MYVIISFRLHLLVHYSTHITYITSRLLLDDRHLETAYHTVDLSLKCDHKPTPALLYISIIVIPIVGNSKLQDQRSLYNAPYVHNAHL